MASIPTSEPLTLIAGDTLAWRREDLSADYSAAAGWALSYRLVNATGKIDIAATASGAAFAVTVAAATSAAYVPGAYNWVATVSKAAERYTIGSGQITVLRDLAAAVTADTRSSAKKALDACNLALENYGAKAYMSEVQVGERRQKFATASEFMVFRSRLQAEVKREEDVDRLAKGLAPRNKLLVRFTR
jgi:hypothetical protein